jgi:hypothetical protein
MYPRRALYLLQIYYNKIKAAGRAAPLFFCYAQRMYRPAKQKTRPLKAKNKGSRRLAKRPKTREAWRCEV